jgi:hypothetical protein
MKYYLTFIFHCAVFITSTFAQTAGDSLFRIGNFRLSAVEFEREAYSATSEFDRNYALFKKSLSFEKNRNYNLALEEVNRINDNVFSDSLKDELQFKSALYLYLNKSFYETEVKIKNYMAIDSSLNKRFYWLLILCLNEQYKWSEAKSNLQKLKIYTGDTLTYLKAYNLYSDDSLPKIKSPEKAEKMNVFLPGLGFIYTGNYREGLVSTGLIAGSLALTALGIYSGYYVVSVLGGLQLFQMFYLGGSRRAEFLARKYNYEKSRKVNDQLAQCLNDLVLN